MPNLDKPLTKSEVEILSSDEKRMKNHIDAHRMFEQEYNSIILGFEKNISIIIQSILGLISIASISSLISFGVNNDQLIINYLQWSAPYLILSVALSILIFVKRKVISIKSWPVAYGYHKDVLIILNETLVKRREILGKLNENFELLYKIYRGSIVLITLYFLSFCFELYTTVFGSEINQKDRIVVNILIISFGILFFYYLTTSKKTVIKDIELNKND